VRQLFRRRYRDRVGHRLIAGWATAAAALVATTAAVPAASLADHAAPELRITSPLGRTGLPGTIRIVARLENLDPHKPVAVQFFVDGQLLASDTDGPPFDAQWTDENPFERRELTARAEVAGDATLTDTVVLEPLELTDVAEITSVLVEATVVDKDGRFIQGLTKSDVEVLEDGEPQALDVMSQQRDPALFAMLVDSSQSMAMRIDAVRATAARLLDALDADDHVVVAPFSRTITSVTGPTTDRSTVLDALRTIRPSGGTAILDALAEAAGTLAVGERRRAIVLITDGYDEHSQSAFEAAVGSLRKSQITLYVVGLGGVAGISLKGEHLLSQLASETGGRAWFPRDERQLALAYSTIASEVRHRYLLAYTPQNQLRDGSWRTISVNVRQPELKVRARKGYTAPMAPPVRPSLEFTAVGNGHAPATLTLTDLVVQEDGVLQRVDTFHEAVNPVTFMLALDGSGSMKRSGAQAQAAAREFVAAMRPEDELGMMLFSNTADLVHSPTKNRDDSLRAIDAYTTEGGTALYDALYDSLERLAKIEGRRVVVVVTDGRDENAASNGPGSLRTFDEVVARLQQVDATVYAVGLGSRVNRDHLQQLADMSGGAAYFPADVTTLNAEYRRILDELRRRYVIAYESSNRSRDGSWRSVEIRSGHNGVQIRSRGGYYAPVQ
jgi:Ca-activated chloride channel homolog